MFDALSWLCRANAFDPFFSPGYTLSTALLQIITFFAEPDLRHVLPVSAVAELHDMVRRFRCATCGHCFAQPNPVILDYKNTGGDNEPKDPSVAVSQAEQEIIELEYESLKARRALIEKLTCGVTKQNVLEDPICLGYPLLINRDRFGRLWSQIVLELISYDAYVAEIQKSGNQKLDYYENAKFRSVTGRDYNHWLPIYINQSHFEQGRTLIQNSISIIYKGTALGNVEHDFQPAMALSVLTSLMNKSSVQLFNGELFESQHAIEAYCHFLRLLMHFIDIYPELGTSGLRG